MKTLIMKNRFTLFLLISVNAILSACASAPEPQPRAFESAETVILQARKLGADDYAPTELTHAQERLDTARSRTEEKDYAGVNNLIEQAEINAELAIARSHVAMAREKVAEKRAANAKLLDTLQNTYPGEFE